ncbi:MAG: baseplate J/gp47 family protein [Oscillospiraceae bacterium]|nr:baseplate J/gp47 family protein [Oscillospiraceae bacterium]
MDYEQILNRMQQKYLEYTGFSADDASDVGIRLKVLAGEAEALYNQMADLRGQIFAQTATGESLELHAETRAITRKPAVPATGILRFSREVPAAADITLSRGILCSTRSDPQIHFETTQDSILAAGTAFVDIPAAAIATGISGNAAPGKVCLIITGAPGITAVTNLASFSGGADAEDDNSLRARLLTGYANISNTTNRAFYYDAAMSHEDVVSANVLPRARGRGTVDVVIACHTPDLEPRAAREIEEYLSLEKEINVDVEVYPAVRDEVNVSVAIDTAAGVNPDHAAEACAGTVRRCLSSLAVGGALLLSKLGRELLEVEGVQNYRIIQPERDIIPLPRSVIRYGNIAVERMMGH